MFTEIHKNYNIEGLFSFLESNTSGIAEIAIIKSVQYVDTRNMQSVIAASVHLFTNLVRLL